MDDVGVQHPYRIGLDLGWGVDEISSVQRHGDEEGDEGTSSSHGGFL